MFTKISEIALLFVFVGIMLILWPTVASYPLPDFFTTTIGNVASRAKMLSGMPIADHLFWWLLFYVRLFIVYYTFRFLLWLLSLIWGKDKSLSVKD